MQGRLNKRKAAALIEQAQLLIRTGAHARAFDVLKPVLDAQVWPGPEVLSVSCEALESLGRDAEACALLEADLPRTLAEPTLTARLGTLLVRLGESRRAVELLSRVHGAFRRDPTFLTTYGAGLLKLGRLAEAESVVAAALLTGGGDDTRLVLALIKRQRGDASGAEAIAVQVGTHTKVETTRANARAVEADCRLLLGDARGALERFRALDAEGQLAPEHLPHAALAAQLTGDEAVATAYMQRRREHAVAEDRLLFAKVFLSRNRPQEALSELERADASPGERLHGYEYERLVAHGRASRLLGKTDEARRSIELAKACPEAELRLLGARVWVEAGHQAAEAGDFVLADESFARALELDPNEKEAALARESSGKRVAWKAVLHASAEARVEAARAETEAMKRRFAAREGELEAMRRELERFKHLSVDAEARARQHAGEAQRLQAEQARGLRDELEARERDVEAKAREVFEAALGPLVARCPEALSRLVLVAERTYQQGLYAALPAAAVAVLYSGALERLLIAVFVERFDAWLSVADRRERFLADALRSKRGRRPEYFDRFAEAFDRSLDGRPPGLGEVARALSRRHEAPLAAFQQFLDIELSMSAEVLEALAGFVQRAKERLRDPVAHGKAIDLGWDELRAFREAFLVRFEAGPCLLSRLVAVL